MSRIKRNALSKGRDSEQSGAAKSKRTQPKIYSRPSRRAAVQARLRLQADEAVDAINTDEMRVTAEELGQIFLDNTIGLYEGFLPNFTVTGELKNFDRTEAGREIQSSVEELGSNSWLDVELVYFGLRKLVQENLRSTDTVHVIPTLTPLLLKSNAEELINHKISLDRAKYDDIILLPVKDVPVDSPIHAENDRRSRLIAQKREEILFLNDLNPAEFIKIYLTKMMDELALDLTQDQQIVIPMRVGQNHYTVAVAHIQNQSASIIYKDSFNRDCPESMKQPIVDFFKGKLGAENVRFETARSHAQSNSYDCGVFAILNGLDMVRQNADLQTSLPTSIDQDYLTMYRGFLFCLYQSLGLKIKMETRLHKLLSQKTNLIFERSDELFKAQQKKQSLQEQAKLLIDLLHNPENGLIDVGSNAVKLGKVRAAVISQGSIDTVLKELKALGDELKQIGRNKEILAPEQVNFIAEQVKQTFGILESTAWLTNPVIQALQKAIGLTVGIIALGFGIAKLPATLALSGLLASQSIFIPVAAALFSACVFFTIKLSNLLSDDSSQRANDLPAMASCCDTSADVLDEHDVLFSEKAVLPVSPAFEHAKASQQQNSAVEKQAPREVKQPRPPQGT